MKLINLATLAITAESVMNNSYGGSAFSPEVRAFGEAMRATMQANPQAGLPEDYFYYQFGNILTDEGLVSFQSETMSMDDGHPFDEDMEHFYDQAETAKPAFASVTHLFGGMLTILYFSA